MNKNIGNYAKHARYWDWSKLDHDRAPEDEYWFRYAERYGKNVLIPMCALGESGAYMAQRGMSVTAFDLTPEMIAEGKKRLGDVQGLHLCEGDVTGFRFDIAPIDFCYSVDFGHILSMNDVKKALVCINNHLRDGGGLVIETTLPPTESSSYPLRTFMPATQVYPGIKVWKTGKGRFEAQTGRHYISQIIYAEDECGQVESFEHSFYLQSYSHEEWLSAFAECGFRLVREYHSREVDSWQSGNGFCGFETVKSTNAKRRYSPSVSYDYLQTSIFRHENVALYNDVINLQQPNDGHLTAYRFDINADGKWVGWIQAKIGYSISAHYDGQIGYVINEEYRNHGYATKACLALVQFLRQCGFEHILLTTDEKNKASRRVCEKIGAALIGIVDTPTWTGIYRQGQRKTCLYEWAINDSIRPSDSLPVLRHDRVVMDDDREYLLERHCRINYECDTPWARKTTYSRYRENWFANTEQQDGFLSSLTDSMSDTRTIAELIRNQDGEIVAYLWAPFHDDDSFVWVDVQDLYIEEPFRGMGIATHLMEYAENVARKNGAMVIRSGTGIENHSSQGLHKKMGYRQYRMEYEKIIGDVIHDK